MQNFGDGITFYRSLKSVYRNERLWVELLYSVLSICSRGGDLPLLKDYHLSYPCETSTSMFSKPADSKNIRTSIPNVAERKAARARCLRPDRIIKCLVQQHRNKTGRHPKGAAVRTPNFAAGWDKASSDLSLDNACSTSLEYCKTHVPESHFQPH